MGNCLGKKQKVNKPNYLQNPQQKPREPEVKLKEHFKDKNQGLSIKSSDINNNNHPCFTQIARDIDRTFKDEQFSKKPENKMNLEKVLKKVALHFPKVGYTQGMNIVVGYFLLDGMSDSQAYKAFSALLVNPDSIFLGFYEDCFPLAELFCSLFWDLLQQRCNKLANKIKQLYIPDTMWIFQWFICFFIYNFPIKYIQKLFVFIMKEKRFSLVRIAVSVMINLQPKFIQLKGNQFQQQFVNCIQHLKDYDYCVKNVPLEKILQTAESIKPNDIAVFLKNDSQNWYQKYLRSPQEDRKAIYQKFIAEKQKERKQFLGMAQSGISFITYERSIDAVQIIQKTQAKMVRRFNKMFLSQPERIAKSLYRPTKKDYSLRQRPSDQASIN